VSSQGGRIAQFAGRRDARWSSRTAALAVPASVVSHTPLSVPPPWDGDFEAAWTLPRGAVSGELLRGPAGQYVAAVVWASPEDCDAWLHAESMEATRAATTVFKACRSEEGGDAAPAPSGAKEAVAAGGGAAAGAAAAAAARLVEQRQGLGSSARPEVDPRTLFAIAAGEDVDIDLEDELVISGGDPSFLDDSLWETGPAASKGKASSAQADDEPGEGDEPTFDEVLKHGGDATFLDDSLWKAAESRSAKGGIRPDKQPAQFEWDGMVDETAHWD